MTMKLELITPENWNDITFNQWCKLIDLLGNSELNELEKRIQQVLIINPLVNRDDLLKLKTTQLAKYFKTIDFLDDEPIKEVWNEIDFGNKKWKLIDFQHMSMAQWIDSEKFAVKPELWSNLVAIFYMDPQHYNDREREELAEYIAEQPCSKVFYLPAEFFFIQTALGMAIKEFSDREMKVKEKAEKIIKATKRVQKWFGFKSSTT